MCVVVSLFTINVFFFFRVALTIQFSLLELAALVEKIIPIALVWY